MHPDLDSLALGIYCLGISHQTAPVTIRERLAFSNHQVESILARIGCGGHSCESPIRELVILSTCNRVELYAVAGQPVFAEMEQLVAESHNLAFSEIRSHFYYHETEAAITHLLAVAAGLDSLVLGEPQILGQVTDAYSLARRHGTAGNILARLFQTSIHAGKRARTETAISHNPASVASMAVNLIHRQITDLSAARVLVIGAGEMAELTVEALRKRPNPRITVANRTIERARNLADLWQGQAASLESLPDLLASAEIVITSTGAPHPIIYAEMLSSARHANDSRPLIFMDIAVPRDVDSGVAAHPNVTLYDLDHLSQGLEESLAQREAEVPAVEAILSEEYSRLVTYLASLDVVPLIKEIRHSAQQIRQAELAKTLRKMPDLSPQEQARIEALTEAIVKKILHQPTRWLQEAATNPYAAEYSGVVRAMFGIDSGN